MATIAALPAVVDSLTSSLVSLPPSLTSTNLTLLSTLLSSFANDVAPVLPDLAGDQQEALLSNSTWLAEQTSQLAALAAQLPASDVEQASHADLVAMIQMAYRRYSIWTLWSPDLWTITLLYLIGTICKVALVGLLSPAAISRTHRVLEDDKGLVGVDRELARAVLQKPARTMLGNVLCQCTGTAALVFQLMAWRFFALPAEHMRMEDVMYMFTALKLVLIGYGAELLFTDQRPAVYLHHGFTFILLFIGQLAVYETKNPKFFFLANWLLLQATTGQILYCGLIFYPCYQYLRVQNYRPDLQRRLLHATYGCLWITKWILIPQKLIPAAFCLYWIGRMWNDVASIAWGRAWLAFAVIVITLMLVLQLVKLTDDFFSMCEHMRHKIYGGPTPPRQGPLFTFVSKRFARPGRRGSQATLVDASALPSSNASMDKVDVQDDKIDATAPVLSPGTMLFPPISSTASWKAALEKIRGGERPDAAPVLMELLQAVQAAPAAKEAAKAAPIVKG
ncbi:hypothetical protein JCM10207_003887 [Rhodosporidiobolus poonsookiae]